MDIQKRNAQLAQARAKLAATRQRAKDIAQFAAECVTEFHECWNAADDESKSNFSTFHSDYLDIFLERANETLVPSDAEWMTVVEAINKSLSGAFRHQLADEIVGWRTDDYETFIGKECYQYFTTWNGQEEVPFVADNYHGNLVTRQEAQEFNFHCDHCGRSYQL